MHIVMRFKGVRKVFLEISDSRNISGHPYSTPGRGCSTICWPPVLPGTRWPVFIRLKCFPWSLTKITRHSKHPITSLQYEYHRCKIFTNIEVQFSTKQMFQSYVYIQPQGIFKELKSTIVKISNFWEK